MTEAKNTLNFAAIGPGPSYEKVHIWLPQLIAEAALRGEGAIEGRTFTDCVLEGPAVLLAIAGCHFGGCNMGDSMGDARNLLLTPMGPTKVTGVIGFKDCKFINCSFLRVGFTGAPQFLSDLIAQLDGPKQ